ncbi:MAG: GumC family protein [Methyloceanibacter sp.]|uniref:GumC family protein n=1 Tax=Methyloceanibacter sp. TaxID=1965321 RepID=UPI003D6D9F71
MVQDARARITPGGAGALVERSFAPLGPARPDDQFLDLAGLIRILRRRMMLIAVTAAVVVSLAAAYAFLTTPTYTASAKVLVDPRKKNTVGTEVVPSGLGTTLGDNFALVDSQVKVITSDAVLRPVVQELHLATDPEFGAQEPSFLSRLLGVFSSPSSAAPDSPEDGALLALTKHVEVERDDQTYVIDISVTTIDPVKAAGIAQAIAQSYLDDQSEDKVETTQRVSALMDGQLAALRDRLHKAEDQVQRFRAEHNLQEAEGVLIDTRQLKVLNEQVTAVKGEVAQAEAKYRQVQLLLKEGVEPEMIGEAIASDTVSRLREQYAIAARREAILGASLLPSHPQLQQARSEVERLRALILAEVERISKAIDLEHEMAKRRLATAEAALAASRHDADINDSARIKLRELEREAETTRTVYESFLARVKEMNEAERIYTPDARIISPAAIPDRPSWPKKKLILALALVFGCGLGGSLAVAAEHLDRRIRNGAELRASTGLKSLASIPVLHAERGLVSELLGRRAKRATFYDMVLEILEGGTRSPFRAAVLRLLSCLVDFDTGGQPRVVLLTSSVSGEGKSALALSLGVAAASSGMRTLLIDANAADPALTKVLGEGDPGPSLSDRIISDQRLGLSFLSLTADHLPLAGWANRNALADELTRVTADYDLTLIDAGLLRMERNGAALIGASQAILFLSRANATSQETAASAASELLQMANGKRCAAVLTMAGDESNR